MAPGEGNTMRRRGTRLTCMFATGVVGGVLLGTAAISAEDTFNPQCFKPVAGHKVITMAARPGPYKVALANGFAGNSWRIQMIQGLKAWAARPENAKDIKELNIVSTGPDVAAQIGELD